MSTLFRSGSELQELIGHAPQPGRGPTVIFWACKAEKELCPKLRAKHPTLDIVCSRENVNRLRGDDRDDETIEKIIGSHVGDRYLIVTWSESHSVDWHNETPVYKRNKKPVIFPENGATAYLLGKYIRDKLKKPSRTVNRSIDIENVRAAIREFCKPSGHAVIIVVGHNDGGCLIKGEVRHEDGITRSETVDDLENISRILDFTDESSGAATVSQSGEDDVVKQSPVNVAMIRGIKASEQFQRVAAATNASNPVYFVANINGLEFSLVDVVCANASDTWLKLVRSLEKRQPIGTPIGRKIAGNLIRVAATRVFNSPEQSILELPVNAIDASVPERPSIGKFGMGFFSLLYWLNGHPKRTLSVVSVVQRQANRIAYCLELYQTDGDYKGKVYMSRSNESCGTVVCLDAENDNISQQNKLTFRYHLERLKYVRTVRVIVNNATINKEVPPDRPKVELTLKSEYLTVSDHGSGLSIDTALSALLTPSLSTKGIEPTAARDDSGTRVILHVNHKSHSVWEQTNGANPSIEIIVAGVIVYLPATYAVASIEMPVWTPVPVARDNIIIDDRSRPFFTALVKDLIQAAIRQSTQTPYTFYLVHKALMNYAEATKQAALIIKEQLHDAYDAHASCIVLPQHLGLYSHVKEKFFIAGYEMNRERVRDQVMKTITGQTYPYFGYSRSRIDPTIFQFHTTVVIDSTQKIDDFSGGLYGAVFINQPPPRKPLRDLQLALCNDLRNGYQLVASPSDSVSDGVVRSVGDIYSVALSNLYKTADYWVGSALFIFEKKEQFQKTWKDHANEIRPLLQAIHDTVKQSAYSRRAEWRIIGYTSDLNPTHEIVYSLTRMYSVYGHKIWMRVATAMADALRRLPANDAAGYHATRRFALAHNDNDFFAEHARTDIQYLAFRRPPDSLINFDADVLQYIWQQAHNIYNYMPLWVYGIAPVCMNAKLVDNGLMYSFIREIVELHAPITTKMNMIRAGYMIVRNVELYKRSHVKPEHVQMLVAWIKNYAYAFDFEINYTTMSKSFTQSISEEDDCMIRLEARRAYDSLAQWSAIVSTGMSPALLTTKLRPHFPNAHRFTTSQLVAHVMSREDSAETLVKTAQNHPLPPNMLQMVGIVINEGNNRDSLTAMLLELMQNAIDAMRLNQRENRNVFIDLQQAGDKVVLSVSDPVGMDYSDLMAMHIPFYSSKSVSVNTTGEMGTGFFNVYRDAESVEVDSVALGSKRSIVWTTYPQRAPSTGRVIDLTNVVEELDSGERGSGTRISIRLKSSSKLSPAEIATNIRTTVVHTLSAVDTRLVHIYLRDVNGRIDRPINHGIASTRLSVPSGQSVINDENSFQCGPVLVTLVPRTVESYVMTNGVPFQSLADFCRASGIRLASGSRAILSSGFSVDLPRQSYEAVQSREWLRLENSTRDDLYAAVLRMICIGAARLCAQVDQANIPVYEKQQALLNLDRAYNAAIPGLIVFINSNVQQFSGESDLVLEQATPQHACEMSAGRLLYRYSIFGSPTIQSLLNDAIFRHGAKNVRVTYGASYPYTEMRQISMQVTERLPPLFRQMFASVLTLWLVYKHYEKKSDEGTTKKVNGNDVPQIVVFGPESNTHKMIAIFIRSYIEAAIKAGISGFSSESVKEIQVVDDPINTSSYFQIDTKMISINSRTHHKSSEDFVQLAANLLTFAQTHKGATIPSKAIEELLASNFYIDLMGYAIEDSGATCVHELEHARRQDVGADSGGVQEGIHGTWTGVLCPSDDPKTETLTFIECQLKTYAIVANQELDGLPFFTALLKRWGEGMDGTN